jgi:beta-lactamase class C
LTTRPPRISSRTLFLLAACLLPHAAQASDDASRIRAIVDATVLPLMREHQIPGMAVGVTVAG